MKELAQIRIESWIKGAIYALLLAGIFYTSHRVMVIWWGREDYSYCYLIAPIVLYLIWEKREALGRLPAQPSWMGVLPLLFGIFLFWLGELAGEFTTMYFASWFVLVGLLWSHLGWEKLKVIWFPVAFIVAMFPPPNFFHFNLTLRLKLISSQIGVWMLQVYGMSAYREGNIIDLGFTQLQVVDACSGLRYLYPLVIMAVLLAYLFKSAWWKKIILVVSAVPLTILTNSFRIAMTGVLYETWGPAVAEDFFHGFSGWFIFMFGFAVLLLEMWALNGFKAFKASGSGKAPEASGKSGLNEFEEGEPGRKITSVNPSSPSCAANFPDTQGDAPRPKGMKAFLSPPQFLAALILLGATLGIAQTVEFREEIPPAKDFAGFPQVVGEWSGKRDRMDQKFIDSLNFNDYVIVDYVNGGRAVNFYTAYYQTQRKGESIHSPETCLPGGGWEFKKGGSVTLPLSTRNGRPMRVNRAFMEKGPHKQLSYFWFPQRDRVLANAWELKLYNFWDALTRQRTDGALVRLITPLYPGEDVADADKRLVSFTQAIVPVLNEYLPK